MFARAVTRSGLTFDIMPRQMLKSNPPARPGDSLGLAERLPHRHGLIAQGGADVIAAPSVRRSCCGRFRRAVAAAPARPGLSDASSPVARATASAR